MHWTQCPFSTDQIGKGVCFLVKQLVRLHGKGNVFFLNFVFASSLKVPFEGLASGRPGSMCNLITCRKYRGISSMSWFLESSLDEQINVQPKVWPPEACEPLWPSCRASR